jgi:hypothetical protein
LIEQQAHPAAYEQHRVWGEIEVEEAEVVQETHGAQDLHEVVQLQIERRPPSCSHEQIRIARNVVRAVGPAHVVVTEVELFDQMRVVDLAQVPAAGGSASVRPGQDAHHGLLQAIECSFESRHARVGFEQLVAPGNQTGGLAPEARALGELVGEPGLGQPLLELEQKLIHRSHVRAHAGCAGSRHARWGRVHVGPA